MDFCRKKSRNRNITRRFVEKCIDLIFFMVFDKVLMIMMMQSNGSFVGDELVYIVIHAVLVFAVVVLATSHKVKKTWHINLHLFFMGKSAFSV